MPLHDGRVACATATLSSAAIGPSTLTLPSSATSGAGVKSLSEVFEGKPDAGTVRHDGVRVAGPLGT